MKRLWLIVAVLFLTFTAVSAAQLPKRGRYNGQSGRLWQSYTRELLLKLFPADSFLVRAIGIDVTPDTEPNAQAHVMRLNLNSSSIKISWGWVLLADNESEYAYPVSHEFQHIKQNRPSTEISTKFGISEDFGALRQYEMEADTLAIQVIRSRGYDPCAAMSAVKKLMDYYGTLDDPENPYNKVGIDRYALIKTYCPIPR